MVGGCAVRPLEGCTGDGDGDRLGRNGEQHRRNDHGQQPSGWLRVRREDPLLYCPVPGEIEIRSRIIVDRPRFDDPLILPAYQPAR